MKRIILLLFIIIFPSLVKSQSIGLTLGSNYYNIAAISEYSQLEYGTIKNITLNYNMHLNGSYSLAFRIGYGWGSNKVSSVSRELQKWTSSDYSSEYSTSGYPIETELLYQHFISQDSVFAPSIGIGVSYCNYKTSYNRIGSNRYEYKTSGISQFISLGMNVFLSRKTSLYIGVKKILLTSITTTHETQDAYYYSFYEKDYAAQTGLSDLGFMFGIYYNI